MKACNLHAVNDLRYEEVPDPVIGPDEVLVKIKAAGICGSDIPRVFTKGTYHFPTIPGHEFAGEIVETAEQDRNLMGAKLAVFPLIPCNECSACQIGEYPQCKNYDYYGSRRDGGFAEYISVRKWNLVFVPENVPFEQAAMCEPCAVAIHALGQVGIMLDDTVAIFGAGTIGLIAAQVAMAWGAKQVVLIDVDSKKLEFAKKIGFTHTVNSMNMDPAEYIADLTGGVGADVALEAAGVGPSLENCLKSIKTFGRVVLMGNPASDMKVAQKAYWEILRKQLTLKGTWNSSYNYSHNDWHSAISCMQSGKIQLEPLITHRFPFSKCKEAFEVMQDKNQFSVKVMFTNE